MRISHPDRPLLADPPLTKGDVARYYAGVAELILPHLAGRPLTLLRCPKRPGEACFVQRHPARGMPASVRPVPAPGKNRPYLTVDDAQGLLALVQFGVIELHPGGARADRPDRPDRLVLDLDPGEGVPWPQVTAAAHELRERLAALGLASFCKTTGGKGLHVVLPIERRHSWEEAKAFARELAEATAAAGPERYTTASAKAERAGRIFLDYLRNDPEASAVAPYSLRARPGAPVAMPVAWEDVTPALEPKAFTIETALARARGRPDPWAALPRCRQRLPRAS